MLSPQHRIMMNEGAREVLIRAKHLIRLPGVRWMKGRLRVTRFALLLERHEILFAEGAATESFRPSPIALSGFSPNIARRSSVFIPDLPTIRRRRFAHRHSH
ncbi:MAG: Hint domain-containing protein [Pseudomonadota bacterium]